MNSIAANPSLTGVGLMVGEEVPIQLTAAQSSAVTGLSLKVINKAIDLQTIPSTAKAKNGVRKREFLAEQGLRVTSGLLALDARGR